MPQPVRYVSSKHRRGLRAVPTMVQRCEMKHGHPFSVIGADDFKEMVRELHMTMDNESISRQIVDDCYRIGIKGLTLYRHVIEELVNKVIQSDWERVLIEGQYR